MSARAATGVSDHYGFAVLMTVALGGGAPVIIDRRRAALRDPELPGSPYHHDTLDMPDEEADALLARVRDSVREKALAGLTSLLETLPRETDIAAMGIRRAPLPHLPMTAAEAHADYQVQCAADGMLYHHYLCEAARTLGIPVQEHKRGEEITNAARAMGWSVAQVEAWLKDEGKRLGAPWQKDHKMAAAAALGLLASHQ